MEMKLKGPPVEITLGRIVSAATHMLEREMSQVLEDLLDGDRNRWGRPRPSSAQRACRVIVACQNLIKETRRYENSRKWEEDIENDVNF